MSVALLWLRIAQSSEEAGMALVESHSRSAVSRFYYAAYSAVHATMLARGQTAPEQGNWTHKGLSEHLESVLSTKRPIALSERDAGLYANKLAELYDLRIEADYGAQRRVDASAAQRSRRLAGPIVRLAERITES